MNLEPRTQNLKPKLGFSLIEFLVVATLIIVISSIVMIGYSASSKNTRDKQREKDMQVVRTAMEQYYEIYKAYPDATSMSDLLNNSAFTEFLQNSDVHDPINSGTYQYTVSSDSTSFQIGYTKEVGGTQVFVNNFGN